jgi:acyl-CoA thioester hydrolase
MGRSIFAISPTPLTLRFENAKTVMKNTPESKGNSAFSRFETEMQVRPDDIDMNKHVHNSRYFDYVLAARYDQMERCYKMPMAEFLVQGYGWVVRTANIEYKRPLGLGDRFIVTTWVHEVYETGVQVHFEIARKQPRKLCCEGFFNYTMIKTATGRAERIPEWIIQKYSI